MRLANPNTGVNLTLIRERIAGIHPAERANTIEGDWRGRALCAALDKLDELQEQVVKTITAHGLTPAPLDGISGQVSQALFDARTKGILEFARAILHGDERHRAWLLAASEEFAENGCVTVDAPDKVTVRP